MIYYRDRICYVVLKEGNTLSYTVPTNPQIAEELLHMNIAHEEMTKK